IIPAVNAFFEPWGHRQLPKGILTQIVTAPAAWNALYLRALLDELRQFGNYEELQTRATQYLSAPDLPKLYDRILTRWHDDFGNNPEHPDLVRRSLCLIACSRFGLGESELLNLLGQDGKPMPRRPLMPFYLAAENALVQRSGLLNFGHDHFCETVRKHWLKNGNDEYAFRQQLTEYFGKITESTSRKIAELPWQYFKMWNWSSLEHLLTSLEISKTLAETRPLDWQVYWRGLIDHADVDVGESYRLAWNQWQMEMPSDVEKLANAAWLAEALRSIRRVGAYSASIFFYEMSLELIKSSESGDAEAIIVGLSEAYQKMGENSKANQWALHLIRPIESDGKQVAAALNLDLDSNQQPSSLREAIESGRSIVKKDIERHSDISGIREGTPEAELIYQAVAIKMAHRCGDVAYRLSETGHPVEATYMLKEVVEVIEESEGPEARDLSYHLNNLGVALKRLRRYYEAESYYCRALAIDEKYYGYCDTRVAIRLRNLSSVLLQQGRFNEAKRCSLRAIEIDEANFGFAHPSVALSWHAYAEDCKHQGELGEAKKAYLKAYDAERQSHGPNHPNVVI
ncbi:MAG: tetratricopeptide repeat protein, partial [Candidatus Methylumidiphilus sp.]